MFCKNSTGKIFGEVEITKDKVIIRHYKKPELIINDINTVNNIINKNLEYILILYDEYELCTGEIAALYNYKYHQMNNLIKSMSPKTSSSYGRRNSSFGQKFSEERIQHLSESHKGVAPVGYERTPEIRQKISDTLVAKYASGEIWNDPKKIFRSMDKGMLQGSKNGKRHTRIYVFYQKSKRYLFSKFIRIKLFYIIRAK